MRKVYSQSVEEKEGGDEPNPIMEQLGTWTAVITSIAGDISKSLGYIALCGMGLAVVGGWIWILILRPVILRRTFSSIGTLCLFTVTTCYWIFSFPRIALRTIP